MKRRLLTLAAVASLVLFGLGCASTADVTNRPEYQTGYVPGRTYTLCRDAYARGSGDTTAIYPTPEVEPGQRPPRVIPAGTRIQVHGLYRLRVAAAQWAAYTSPLATFVDGPLSGSQVHLGAISTQIAGPDVGSGNWIDAPDPELLSVE